MTRDDKRDITILGASLFGVLVGSILDERRRDDKPDALAGRAEAQSVISVPALMTASTISRKVGDAAGVDEQSILRQAIVAFCTGLALTYFADAARRFLPGLR